MSRDPVTRACQVEPLPFQRGERVLDPECQDVAVPLTRQVAVQLRARQDEQSFRRWRSAARPVIGDREDVVPCPLVVLDERAGSELAVGLGRVGVQRAPEPGPFCPPWVIHVAAAYSTPNSSHKAIPKNSLHGDANNRTIASPANSGKAG